MAESSTSDLETYRKVKGRAHKALFSMATLGMLREAVRPGEDDDRLDRMRPYLEELDSLGGDGISEMDEVYKTLGKMVEHGVGKEGKEFGDAVKGLGGALAGIYAVRMVEEAVDQKGGIKRKLRVLEKYSGPFRAALDAAGIDLNDDSLTKALGGIDVDVYLAEALFGDEGPPRALKGRKKATIIGLRTLFGQKRPIADYQKFVEYITSNDEAKNLVDVDGDKVKVRRENIPRVKGVINKYRGNPATGDGQPREGRTGLRQIIVDLGMRLKYQLIAERAVEDPEIKGYITKLGKGYSVRNADVTAVTRRIGAYKT